MPSRKLSKKDIEEIISLSSKHGSIRLSKMFGVSSARIVQILKENSRSSVNEKVVNRIKAANQKGAIVDRDMIKSLAIEEFEARGMENCRVSSGFVTDIESSVNQTEKQFSEISWALKQKVANVSIYHLRESVLRRGSKFVSLVEVTSIESGRKETILNSNEKNIPIHADSSFFILKEKSKYYNIFESLIKFNSSLNSPCVLLINRVAQITPDLYRILHMLTNFKIFIYDFENHDDIQHKKLKDFDFIRERIQEDFRRCFLNINIGCLLEVPTSTIIRDRFLSLMQNLHDLKLPKELKKIDKLFRVNFPQKIDEKFANLGFKSVQNKNFTVAQRLKAVSLVNDGFSKIRIAEVIQKDIKCLNSYILNIEELKSTKISSKTRKFDNRFNLLNEILFELVEKDLDGGKLISFSDLERRAKECAEILGVENYKGSYNGLQNFMKSYDLRLRRSHGDRLSVPEESIDIFHAGISMHLRNRTPSEIYNLDEAGVYPFIYNKKFLVKKGDNLHGFKMQKDRFTVLCCANAAGEKRDLLILGNTKNPRSFMSGDKDNLNYISSPKAWMNSSIFLNYLTKWDEELETKGTSVVLILDNASSHGTVEKVQHMLKRIELFYLPENTTSVCQPLDAGAIRSFKSIFRRLISDFAQDNQIEYDDYKKKISKRDYISLSKEAWEKVEVQTIINCFQHVGILEKTHKDEEEIREETSKSIEEISKYFSLLNKMGSISVLESIILR